jgi:glycolate oxidase iron-sulfur subunit
MDARLASFVRGTPAGSSAEEVLRACVHCGFCNATCPTYQIFGDELDGPRGRIYLIKHLLETGEASAKTRLHLDRCLTCGSCETTCPSGVRYSRLLDLGREIVERRVPRTGLDRLARRALGFLLTRPTLFGAALGAGRSLRPLLPAALRAKVPAFRDPGAVPAPRHGRRMIALAGCVQPAMMPAVNAAAARVLDRLGISLIEAQGAACCGALRFHLTDVEAARADARRNVDAWWPLLDGGCEAIVMTASGCGAHVRDYGHLLRGDTAYADRAAGVARATRDVSEVVHAERAALPALVPASPPATHRPATRVAFHAPCTLQHAQKVRGLVEGLLAAVGYDLAPVTDTHLCCGAAGTYSILQPEIATRLRDDKLAAVRARGGTSGLDLVASANVGCITHLQAGTTVPVRHWIELIDERLKS